MDKAGKDGRKSKTRPSTSFSPSFSQRSQEKKKLGKCTSSFTPTTMKQIPSCSMREWAESLQANQFQRLKSGSVSLNSIKSHHQEPQTQNPERKSVKSTKRSSGKKELSRFIENIPLPETLSTHLNTMFLAKESEPKMKENETFTKPDLIGDASKNDAELEEFKRELEPKSACTTLELKTTKLGILVPNGVRTEDKIIYTHSDSETETSEDSEMESEEDSTPPTPQPKQKKEDDQKDKGVPEGAETSEVPVIPEVQEVYVPRMIKTRIRPLNAVDEFGPNKLEFLTAADQIRKKKISKTYPLVIFPRNSGFVKTNCTFNGPLRKDVLKTMMKSPNHKIPKGYTGYFEYSDFRGFTDSEITLTLDDCDFTLKIEGRRAQSRLFTERILTEILNLPKALPFFDIIVEREESGYILVRGDY